jgi:hypothetical protein
MGTPFTTRHDRPDVLSGRERGEDVAHAAVVAGEDEIAADVGQRL